MLFRECDTARLKQVVSEEPYLRPEFVFKKYIKKLNYPSGVHFQLAEKNSYRVENMLETMKHLINKVNPFTCKNFDIYICDNYGVNCADNIENTLLVKGYMKIIMGGGI